MRQFDVRVPPRRARYGFGEGILRVLYQRWIVILVVLGINVLVNNVVAIAAQQREAVRFAVEVRRAEIRREEAKDVSKGHLVVEDLGVLDGRVDLAQVAVRPGVAGELVAGGVHARQDGGPGRRGAVHLPLAQVVAHDEEGGLCAELVEQVEQLARVVPWPVVKGQGHRAWRRARGDCDP